MLLLDRTGTITVGNRQATAFTPLSGASVGELAEAALLSSLADETPEGRIIVVLARERHRVDAAMPIGAEVIPFSASTRLSELRVGSSLIKKARSTAR